MMAFKRTTGMASETTSSPSLFIRTLRMIAPWAAWRTSDSRLVPRVGTSL